MVRPFRRSFPFHRQAEKKPRIAPLLHTGAAHFDTWVAVTTGTEEVTTSANRRAVTERCAKSRERRRRGRWKVREQGPPTVASSRRMRPPFCKCRSTLAVGTTDSACGGGALSLYGYAVLRTTTAKGTIFSGCQRPVQNYGTKCTQSPVPGT